ncbi:hypothetical protein R3P38DRAFT_3362875 [Favolaschia claudopus]|uniref:Uncharacterized protein n=1 Tax=Favolaschia claudopus TaxID=2862362 RepID=A0AAW0AKY4_9AGAR
MEDCVWWGEKFMVHMGSIQFPDHPDELVIAVKRMLMHDSDDRVVWMEGARASELKRLSEEFCQRAEDMDVQLPDFEVASVCLLTDTESGKLSLAQPWRHGTRVDMVHFDPTRIWFAQALNALSHYTYEASNFNSVYVDFEAIYESILSCTDDSEQDEIHLHKLREEDRNYIVLPPYLGRWKEVTTLSATEEEVREAKELFISSSKGATALKKDFAKDGLCMFDHDGRPYIRVEGPEGYGNFILAWTADQHRGQAKGLGLHLQKLSSNMAPRSDYNTPQCPVAEHVRWFMRSLVCIEHDDWEDTVLKIREKGGKAENVAVIDICQQTTRKFFYAGICWERSFVPLNIWNAGDANSNLIESVHRDVNREGVHCTLLGGLKKGQLFDAVKMKTLKNYGITPSFKTGHRSENAYHNNFKRECICRLITS